MAKICIETYGCTLNQADSDIMKGILNANGHIIENDEKKADIIVLNTCTVKGATESRIMERIRSLAKGGKPIVVAGCLVVNKERIKGIVPDVVLVWPSAISKIVDAIAMAKKGIACEIRDRKKDYYIRHFTSPILRIPIGEGCAGNCHFCQTRQARPVLSNYPARTIMEWTARGVERGAREIQLTSMDCGCYGIGNNTSLPQLLDKLCAIEGDFRIRLGMINPEHILTMEKELADALNHKKMFSFLHAPVQSGSDKVCELMNRKHSASDFIGISVRMKKQVPELLIATDIIVGYPGEDEEDFMDTKRMLQRVRPDVVNISKFSPRPGTRAKDMEKIPSEEVKRRSADLSELLREMRVEKNKEMIGKTLDVLVTEKKKDYTARANNYKQVVVKNYSGGLGEWIRVRIDDACHSAVIGNSVETLPEVGGNSMETLPGQSAKSDIPEYGNPQE
jgi:MiaB-like tRNA modifying enzyme